MSSSPLADYQDAFAAALLADDPQTDAPPALAQLVRQPGFAVYRNTVLKACIDALQANFPTIERLVGAEWLRAAASVHARERLPTRTSLLHYGEHFPEFLAAFEPAREWPWLGAVAQIDRWWTEAHAAADDALLEPATLAALSTAEMVCVRLRPHAAARWSWCHDWPVATLWQRNRDPSAGAAAIDWRAEGVLITRPIGRVQVEVLSQAGATLLDASAAGWSIADAVAAALATEPRADVAALIRQLLDAGAFGGIDPLSSQTPPSP